MMFSVRTTPELCEEQHRSIQISSQDWVCWESAQDCEWENKEDWAQDEGAEGLKTFQSEWSDVYLL